VRELLQQAKEPRRVDNGGGEEVEGKGKGKGKVKKKEEG
jgi:hypothetical protein